MTAPAALECRSHEWRFLRKGDRTVVLPRDARTVYHRVERYDTFYCSRCLNYNEVVTYSKKYVVVPPPPYVHVPTWDEKLYTWWYSLTHKPNRSAKEAARS